MARSMETYRSGPAVGTPEQIVEALADLQDLGMTYAITNFTEAAYDLTGIELFEREVIPGAALSVRSHTETGERTGIRRR